MVFEAPEYHGDGSLRSAAYEFAGSCESGWRVLRNGERHLELGPGYRLLRTLCCGICSTDLDRHFLPFPLPQVTGHELVARDRAGRRYVVEINASHAARAVTDACPFCSSGLSRHCPERIVLGIHDLPGGFGAWVLVPKRAAIAIPPELSDEAAALIEPFAAARNAVERIAPRAGDRLAVLGTRRLGLLVVAALAAERRAKKLDFTILALSRGQDLLARSLELGADEGVVVTGDGESLDSGLADVVVDTTASPAGLELALRLAAREVHVKSTHGQPSGGLRHVTELVVDEISLARFPTAESEGLERLRRLGRFRADGRPRVVWLASALPPQWLGPNADVLVESDAARALSVVESAADGLPRADIAVLDESAGIDEVLRPSEARPVSLVRPRGEILLLASARSSEAAAPLPHAVIERGLRVSSSRCGDFHAALAALGRDPELKRVSRTLITHRFPVHQIERAFSVARSHRCIKVLVQHPVEGR